VAAEGSSIIYCIVLDRGGTRFLVLPGREAWSLPTFHVPRQQMPLVENVRARLLNDFGVNTTIVDHWVERSRHPNSVSQFVYIAEALLPGLNRTPEYCWRNIIPAGDDLIEPIEASAWISTWLEKSETAYRTSTWWRRVGWYDDVRLWIGAQLQRRDATLVGHPQQVRVSEGSYVLRCASTAGEVYFKAVCSRGKREITVLKHFSNSLPRLFPEVLAVDEDRNWVLTSAAPGRPLHTVTTPEPWHMVLRAYAEIQLQSVGWTESLLKDEAADRTVPTLQTRLADSVIEFQQMNSRMFGRSLDNHHIATVLDRSFEALKVIPLPATLHHDDLHPANIQVESVSSCIFLDWAGASVAHPFFGPVILLGYIECLLPDLQNHIPALRDTYLSAWTSIAPLANLRIAFDAARPLATLDYAISSGRAVTHEAMSQADASRRLGRMLMFCSDELKRPAHV
jgi:hypothetical protein